MSFQQNTRTKGRLLRVRWVESRGPQVVCYTCKYHNWDAITPAVEIRVQDYERVIQKTYFCAKHAASARASVGELVNA